MGRNGGCDFSELQAFAERMEHLAETMNVEIEFLAKQIAQMLLEKVIKATPVGRYDGAAYVCESKLSHKGMRNKNGKKGGTLRRAWTGSVYRSGNLVVVKIENPMFYAPYVEYGHRTVNGGWAEGHFMMTTSVNEVLRDGPAILEKKIAQRMEASLR
ncbi:HK97 gp10 family phage protein [Anaerovoracaceae bacterium 42-11]